MEHGFTALSGDDSRAIAVAAAGDRHVHPLAYDDALSKGALEDADFPARARQRVDRRLDRRKVTVAVNTVADVMRTARFDAGERIEYDAAILDRALGEMSIGTFSRSAASNSALTENRSTGTAPAWVTSRACEPVGRVGTVMVREIDSGLN